MENIASMMENIASMMENIVRVLSFHVEPLEITTNSLGTRVAHTARGPC